MHKARNLKLLKIFIVVISLLFMLQAVAFNVAARNIDLGICEIPSLPKPPIPEVFLDCIFTGPVDPNAINVPHYEIKGSLFLVSDILGVIGVIGFIYYFIALRNKK